MSLAELKPGRKAIISEVSSEAPRLLELGFFVGSEIQVSVPGNPMIVKILGSSFCIRKDLAQKIKVQGE